MSPSNNIRQEHARVLIDLATQRTTPSTLSSASASRRPSMQFTQSSVGVGNSNPLTQTQHEADEDVGFAVFAAAAAAVAAEADDDEVEEVVAPPKKNRLGPLESVTTLDNVIVGPKDEDDIQYHGAKHRIEKKKPLNAPEFTRIVNINYIKIVDLKVSHLRYWCMELGMKKADNKTSLRCALKYELCERIIHYKIKGLPTNEEDDRKPSAVKEGSMNR